MTTKNLKLQKGLRLNDENRGLIARAIVDEKIGKEIEKAHHNQRAVAAFVQDLLITELSGEYAQEEATYAALRTKGLLPTIDKLSLDFQLYPDFSRLIPFQEEIGIPWKFYEVHAKGSITEEAFKLITSHDGFAELEEMVLFYAATKKKERDSLSKMMSFLRGFTSPQKLIDAHPNFETFLPKDMWDEETAVEAVSIDDILAA